MNDFQRILIACRCAVYLSINDHRNLYLSAAEWLEQQECLGTDIDHHARSMMIDTDTIVDLQFYPSTPIGFYRILHWNLDEAIRLGLECLKESFCD